MPTFLFETEDEWSVTQVGGDEDVNNNNIEDVASVEDEVERRANLNHEVPVEEPAQAERPVEAEDTVENQVPVQQNPNGNSVNVKEVIKGKRDITSAYLSKCEKDSELAEKKFKWEQELHKENMLARQNDLVNKNKQEVMLKCIDKGYSPTTSKRFMSSLFDDNID